MEPPAKAVWLCCDERGCFRTEMRTATSRECRSGSAHPDASREIPAAGRRSPVRRGRITAKLINCTAPCTRQSSACTCRAVPESRPGLKHSKHLHIRMSSSLSLRLNPSKRFALDLTEHQSTELSGGSTTRRVERNEKPWPYHERADDREILASAHLPCGHWRGRHSNRAGHLRLSTSEDVLGRRCLCDSGQVG